MRIVLRVYSSNEFDDGGAAAAVVELDEERLADLRRRVEIAREILAKDGELSDVSFDDWLDFYPFFPGEEQRVGTDWWPRGWYTLDDDVQLPEETDDDDVPWPDISVCNLHVAHRWSPPDRPAGETDFEIYWTALPRDSDVELTTQALTLTDYEEAFRRSQQPTTKEHL